MTDRFEAGRLADYIARLFGAAGVPAAAARVVADSLVDADLSGQPSHGVMLVDMYLDRLHHGSVSLVTEAEVVRDRDGAVILDARHALGVLAGDQAMEMAVVRARRHGTGVVAVRHGFHFGMARRYAAAAADMGCVGLAMCNTRPLMPAPGGAERVVGNNPIAIAIPTAGEVPLVLDMATSEAAMGKDRLAANAGRPIPPGWAVRADGAPTTDAEAAVAGMLLPAAGPKGFGLALMIDMLSGLLSGGASGASVRPLYGDPAAPYDCSMLFIAIDVPHFRDLDEVRKEAEMAARHIREGGRAPGVDRLHTPGSGAWLRRRASAGYVRLEPSVRDMLTRMAAEVGLAEFLPLATTAETEKETNRDQA